MLGICGPDKRLWRTVALGGLEAGGTVEVRQIPKTD